MLDGLHVTQAGVPPGGAMQHTVLQAGAHASVAPAQRTTEEALALLSSGPASAAVAPGDDDFASAQSLWFKKEAFTAPEFDPDEYVRDLQRFVRARGLSPSHHPSCRCCAAPPADLTHVHPGVARAPCAQVPLEALRAALDTHLATLKNEVRCRKAWLLCECLGPRR